MTTVNQLPLITFRSDVNEILMNGQQSISHVQCELRDKGWAGLGTLYDLQLKLEKAGFHIHCERRANGDIYKRLIRKTFASAREQYHARRAGLGAI